MKLTIELVPSSAHFKNYRNKYPERWKDAKKMCYRLAGHKCEVCGGKGPKWPVEAHEVWEFDDKTGIQKLVKLQALCPSCHEVKHIGLAELRGHFDRAFYHLMKVNKWSNRRAHNYVLSAFALYHKRSDRKWKLDCSLLEKYH